MNMAGSIGHDPVGWHPDWLAKLRRKSVALWRGVEAQHHIATIGFHGAASNAPLPDALFRSGFEN